MSRIHAASFVLGGLIGASIGVGALTLLSDGRSSGDADPRERTDTDRSATAPAQSPEGNAPRQDAPAVAAPKTADAQPLRTPVPPSIDELRQLLASSSRLDQVRAIELLVQARTLESWKALLDALLASTDNVLLTLLEDALVRCPLEVAPAVMTAFDTSKDARVLGRLASILAQLAAKSPTLEQDVVAHFIRALKDSEQNPERAKSASSALVTMGAGALDQLTSYVADAQADPAGAGTAAWVLGQLPAAHGDRLRQRVEKGFDAISRSLTDPALSAEVKEGALKKTGSLAWAASLRPQAEHDLLADVMVDNLIKTSDQAQAGTLAWGIGNLKGLSNDARLRITRSLLDSLVAQPNGTIAHAYLRTVNQLATSEGTRPIDASFLEIRRLVESAAELHRGDANASRRIQWLRDQLTAHQQKMGR